MNRYAYNDIKNLVTSNSEKNVLFCVYFILKFNTAWVWDNIPLSNILVN